MPIDAKSMLEATDLRYSRVNGPSDGRIVLDSVPNTSSISASLSEYEELPGIRDVPLSDFHLTGKSYSASETERIERLSRSIQDSGEISPLIVVVDTDGPYILEGAHRAEALFLLGAKSFPAVVVVDLEGWGKEASSFDVVVKTAEAPGRSDNVVIFSDEYENLQALIAAVNNGELLVHARQVNPMGINELQHGIYPTWGETLSGTEASREADEYGIKPAELVFASDGFKWVGGTRNAAVFVKKDGFQKSLGNGKVELPNGSTVRYEMSPIADFENEALKGEPFGVETGDWYSDKVADVVAVAIVREGESLKASVFDVVVKTADDDQGFSMPTTGTTVGDVSLPLYRFVSGDELRQDGLGTHWTHSRKEVDDMASYEAGFIITAKHPGAASIMDWENPNDRKIMERSIGGYEYRDKVFPEVPVRPGTEMNVVKIEKIDADGNRSVVKTPRGFSRHANRIDMRTPDDAKSADITDSASFKAWFSGSKVVDAAGNPLMVHHGSHSGGFTEFKTPAFFTSSKEDTGWWTEGYENSKRYDVYLSIKSPLNYGTKEGYEKLIEEARKTGLNVETEPYFFCGAIDKHSAYDGSNPLDLVYIPEVVKQLKSSGYDGIIGDDMMTNYEISVFIVFDPSQIKSAVDNKGSFDASNPDITASFNMVVKMASSDDEYMKAVESGDMTTAQRLVDEAATAAGYVMEVFRGDSDANNIFEYHPKDRQNFGIFTTQNKGIADSYAGSSKDARRFLLKASNVLDLSNANENIEASRWVHEWAKSFDEWVDKESGEPIDPADAVAYGTLYDYEGDWSMERWEDLQATAKSEGYDALIVNDWHRHEGENVSVVVFNSSNLKLADAIVKDGAGNVIPLSKRFDSGSNDIRFEATAPIIRVAQTEEQMEDFDLQVAPAGPDAEYFAAIESGDTATVQRLVDNAASAAGYSVKAAHSTNAPIFNEFRTGGLGAHFGTQQAAEDRTKSLRDFSVGIGRSPGNFRTMNVYLSISNPLRLPDMASLDDNGEPMKDLDDDDMQNLEDMGKEIPRPRAWEGDEDVQLTLLELGVINIDEFEECRGRDKTELVELLKGMGYDGIIYKNHVENPGEDSYIIFDPNQVKSADLVVKDDSGNVIPPSKRFGTGSNDMRFDVSTPVVRKASNEVGLPYSKHVFGLTDDNGHSESYVGDAMALHSDFKWDKSLLSGRTWRYVPSTGNICIWDEFTPEVEAGIVDHLADRYGIENTRISLPEFRRTAGVGLKGVPEEVGTMPIPNGHVRLYHYTRADPEVIRKEGLKLSMARGSTYGEPNMVWASSVPMTESKNVVEFSAPSDDPSMSLERPNKGQDPAEWMKGNHHVGFGRDIRPDEILAIHEPWHKFYRYIKDNPKTMKDIADGKLDDLDATYHPNEFKAVQKIKKEIGTVDKSVVTAAKSSSRVPRPKFIPNQKFIHMSADAASLINNGWDSSREGSVGGSLYKGISVTLPDYVDSWKHIAKLGGTTPVWVTLPAGKKLLDFYGTFGSKDVSDNPYVSEWAKKQGRWQETTRTQVAHYDEDGEIMGWMDEDPSEDFEIDVNGEHDDDNPEVREYTGFSWDDHEAIYKAYVEQMIPEACGVWYWDVDDPMGLSAPQGNIDVRFAGALRFSPASSQKRTASVAGIKAYHGSGTNIQEFSYEFAGMGEDQLGSGFYFTTDEQEAFGYTTNRNQSNEEKPGGEDSPTVLEVRLDIKRPLDADAVGTIPKAKVRKLIMMSPILDEALIDWGDVEFEGRETVLSKAVEACAHQATSNVIVRALFPIANDFYRGHIKEFNDAVTQVLGYDGVVKHFDNPNGCFAMRDHYVAFRPDQIRIIDRKPAIKTASEQMEFNLDIQTNSKPVRLEDINALRQDIANAANKILDAWQQDDDGMDEEFGSGGACDAIAHEIQGILSQHGYDVSEGGQDGDDHAWVVVYDDATALAVDIPPGVYETGAGYSWKKIEGAHVNPEDIQVGTTWREAVRVEKNAGTVDSGEHPVAAVIVAAGRIFEGRTHFEALQKAKMLGYVEDGDDGNIVDRNGKVMNYDGSIDLFMTNKGRLIDRFEAMAMGKATGAEYIPEKDRDDVDTIIKRHAGVEARVSERDNGTIVLDHLRVPRESRSEGLGSAFMQDLCAYADRRGKDIELSLGDKRPGETTSKGRLIKFYGRFGFVRNFGRTTDYRRSCQMYRRPQGKKAAGSGFELMATSAVKDGWFGSSKVVDANGDPLVVYHGSRNPMTEDFSHDLEGTGVASGGNGQTKYGGFFFTSEPDNAQFFADPKDLNELNPDLVSAYGEGDEWYYSAADDEGNDWLNGGKFKTPELAEKAGQAHVKRFNEALQRQEDMFVRGYNLRIENPLEIDSKEMGSNKWSPPMLIPLAKDAGKDGVIIRGYQDGAMESNIYIVFDGSQVRPSKTGQLKAAEDQSFEIVITGSLNTDTGVDDAPAAGHLDTQLFEGCKGTKFDRDVVGKYRRRLKHRKVKKAQVEQERDLNGEMIAELEAEYRQKWTPVTSSMIREVAYDIKTGELTFKMKNHAEYSFRNVPKSEYDAFMAAESKGKWFADFRKRYRESKAIEDRAMRSEAKTSGGLAKTAASWGTAGSGVMYFCPDDNSVLLLERSEEVMDGGTWGIPGGAVNGTEGMYGDDELDGKDFDEETLRSSAHKEVEEEMGHVPDGKDMGSVTIPFGKFKYTTFFKSVSQGQKDVILNAVELNWESTDKRWFSLSALPKNTHPGVIKAIELKFGK